MSRADSLPTPVFLWLLLEPFVVGPVLALLKWEGLLGWLFP